MLRTRAGGDFAGLHMMHPLVPPSLCTPCRGQTKPYCDVQSGMPTRDTLEHASSLSGVSAEHRRACDDTQRQAGASGTPSLCPVMAHRTQGLGS